MKHSLLFGSLVATFWCLAAGGAPLIPGSVLASRAAAADQVGITLGNTEVGGYVKASEVKQCIGDYVAERTHERGFFPARDPILKKEWRLSFVKIQDPVRQFDMGGKRVYFACCEFKDVDRGAVLDIDVWTTLAGDALRVTGTKIHRINGELRYTYEGTDLQDVP